MCVVILIEFLSLCNKLNLQNLVNSVILCVFFVKLNFDEHSVRSVIDEQ